VTLLIGYLGKHGVFNKISEQVRFARRRFGRYEVIDFLAVLFGYAASGEHTLEAFYKRLQPFAIPFMALVDRDQLPARSTLSRFLAALPAEPVETLRTLFLDDLLSRPLTHDKQTGGLVDRAGNAWMVFDIDGTREAARQRALPKTEDLPPAFRRLDDLCAPGYRGRKRGQVVRTRTVISQAHSFQWLGSFGNRGNGQYRKELRQGLLAIGRYLTAHQLSPERTLLRLDGQYGTGAALSDLAGFAFVTRGKDYMVLDHPLVQARLHLPPDQFQQRPESQTVRSLYDCPEVPIGPEGVRSRVVVATHPATKKKSPVGVTRAGVVYELFFTPFRKRLSPPLTLWNCISIVERLSQPSRMKIRSKIPTVGVATRPGDRSAGRWWRNGPGTCGWNWDITSTLIRSAPPSLLQLFLRLHPRHLFRQTSPSRLAMRPLTSACSGRPAAFLVRTLHSSPMARSSVPLTRSCFRMNTAEKPMGACAWCMEPASAVAARVRFVRSVNGRGAPPANHARSASCCIHWLPGMRRFSGGTGAAESIDVPVWRWSVSNTSR
jgi:hypothetical protein